MNEKKQRGGKRERAGRPFTLQDAKRITIVLEGQQLDWIKSQGEAGEVIRRLIDEAKAKND